ncbi:MAG: Lrp/AsnC family transcriptional regulator [Verrucomicrobiae bacterium]|nr:Lrp/AsnC family transcriptional regulator [Verrucomicrobiae bacterium]
MSASAPTIPTQHSDPTNAKILSVSEDLVEGFQRHPFQHIAEKSGVPLETVIERVRAMTADGVIRRTRQTLLATKLAHGALCAWKVDPDKIDATFDWMFREDPFSGHVVTRSTDREISGSDYRLWTTLKVPQGESLDEHATALKRITGAHEYILMPAKGIFALGVGHVRRKSMEPGDRADEPAKMTNTATVDLSPVEWDVLLAMKEELSLDEIGENPWESRAAIAGVDLDTFFEIAETLDRKKVIGRFSTFLEHVKPSKSSGERVTRFNALFHWKVPEGMQERAGGEVGRHPIMTHCYWREGGPQFGGVNIMGVIHGTDRDRVLAHKAAIDAHLAACDIPLLYTNVFWGGRSEIKPSEISPKVYREFHDKWAGQTNVI